MILASVMKTISLTQLLSSCMDASRQGCEVIQEFHRKAIGGNGVSGTMKENGEIKSVVTQADIDAQARIVGGLREAWGDKLRIIGEEDEEVAKPNTDGVALDKSILVKLNGNVVDEEIPLDDIALFVDPLDGTREFVEGRLHNVACLIGIVRKRRPIAGVIGLPFPEGCIDVPVRVHYAIADQPGSASSWSTSAELPDPTDTSTTTGITILTGDSKDPILLNATACAKSIAENANHVLVGGTAAKLRIVATQPNSLAILHFKTELWDTCSPQALMESFGGKITDLFGSPLVHAPDRQIGNIFGVVASSGEMGIMKIHDELCSRMRADVESVHKIFGKYTGSAMPSNPQAVDVARDLDGIPLSVKQLEKDILQNQPGLSGNLKSYSVPEKGAWRGMMSNGGRLYLEWQQEDSQESLPSSVFYKRIVMADLAHARDKLKAAPHKLVRDVKSYQVETSFLTSKACNSLRKDTGIRINDVYGSDLRPIPDGLGPKEQLESRFSVLLEDFNSDDGWRQQWLLDEQGTRAALKTFANFHAYFWTGSMFWKKEGGKLGEELSQAVWTNGGYMQPKLQGLEQLGRVAEGWKKRFPTFESALEDISEFGAAVDPRSLGTRLQNIATLVGDKAHPFGTMNETYDSYRTLIHGDPKQANIFFRRGDDGDLEVGLIDFQWSGFGLAATDIAHHISAAVSPACVSYDGSKEKELLDYYYDCLTKGLVEYGVAGTAEEVQEKIFPRSVFQEQYDTALLDVCRMVFAYAWQRWKVETHPTPESLNRNAYNKSLESALWLICRCEALLAKQESYFAAT